MFNREILYEQELPNVSNKAPYYLIFFFSSPDESGHAVNKLLFTSKRSVNQLLEITDVCLRHSQAQSRTCLSEQKRAVPR